MYARNQHVNPSVNAHALALMFQRPMNGNLYLPQPQQSYQAVAADVDQDGDEDKYAVRFAPIVELAGCVLATTGGTGDITYEPQKWTQPLSFEFVKEDVAGILVTNFVIGQEPLFPQSGKAMPLGVWCEQAKEKLFDAPFCGPNVPLILSLKNVNTSEKTIWGGIRARIIVG